MLYINKCHYVMIQQTITGITLHLPPDYETTVEIIENLRYDSLMVIEHSYVF